MRLIQWSSRHKSKSCSVWDLFVSSLSSENKVKNKVTYYISIFFVVSKLKKHTFTVLLYALLVLIWCKTTAELSSECTEPVLWRKENELILYSKFSWQFVCSDYLTAIYTETNMQEDCSLWLPREQLWNFCILQTVMGWQPLLCATQITSIPCVYPINKKVLYTVVLKKTAEI